MLVQSLLRRKALFGSLTIIENLKGVAHTASITVAPPTYPAKPTVYPAAPNFTINPATAWYGGITIDGVYKAPPAGCDITTEVDWTSAYSLGEVACWPAYLDGGQRRRNE